MNDDILGPLVILACIILTAVNIRRRVPRPKVDGSLRDDIREYRRVRKASRAAKDAPPA